MASTAPDLQTELRKRARRRLLGAIALALTAAIVLPVVMDHEPRAPAQDIAVRIPPRDSLPALAQPARPETTEADVMIPPAPPDSESNAPVTTESVPVVPPAPVAAPAKAEPPKPAAAPAAASEVSRVAALLDGKSGSFALQLGVFSDAANVAKLRARARELGFPTFTEPVKLENGQSRTRVKVGPFPSRAAAEAAQRKLEAAGMRSMVAPAA
ncbi:SPOR domain-containing protein [Methyloversatilis sp.]|uniref:SPOR domain-containing protein n=1 Tax=Methyloversatilis sp. TaxID=2569862 RepID=UPI0027333BC6|nr:SPOR domain-containing protein [Methyloversatilis sp.]MDP2868973.1 SPOR domain-containing protein [Methyloversatilis sp.]MDP3454596.1 SPOR domain-containing protein [Methyloversatilis sp.]MDP3580194.1 SPOR domain-containing protein [Methyloversatilis sp.]